MDAECPRCWLPVERFPSMAGIWTDLDPAPPETGKRKKGDRRFVVVEGILMDTSHHRDCPQYVPHELNCDG